MSRKAETFIDKNGKSWLVFYDRDGDKEYDLWTTNNKENEITHSYKIETTRGELYINFEVRLFPNGKYGVGHSNNVFYDNFEKIFSTHGRSFNSELEALQFMWLRIKEKQISCHDNMAAKRLIELVDKELIPQTLF